VLGRTSLDEENTAAVAAAVAGSMKEGDVVLLEGAVGAGKTTFVRHLARHLGCDEHIHSPTYTVGHLHKAGADRSFAHLDLYRTNELDPSSLGDIEPYFDATWCAIEWSAPIAPWLDRPTIRVSIDLLAERARVIRIDAEPQTMQRIVDRLVPERP
jgi:tRNA threonylcarbamoyladenosine biosynthesis protein TsaE